MNYNRAKERASGGGYTRSPSPSNRYKENKNNKDNVVLINKPKKRLEPIKLSNTIVMSSSQESLNTCES